MLNYSVYIVECCDKSLYTGMTANLAVRIAQHNDGTGAKYTKTRRPVELLVSFPARNKSSALKLEYKIKQLSRQDKINLVHTEIVKEKAKIVLAKVHRTPENFGSTQEVFISYVLAVLQMAIAEELALHFYDKWVILNKNNLQAQFDKDWAREVVKEALQLLEI